MNFAKSGSKDAKEEFWAVVRDCLQEFHKLDGVMARRKAAQLRKSIENLQEDGAEFSITRSRSTWPAT
jgi:hypothetical protein